MQEGYLGRGSGVGVANEGEHGVEMGHVGGADLLGGRIGVGIEGGVGEVEAALVELGAE